MDKMMGGKAYSGKGRVTGLRATSEVNFVSGKDPRKVITNLSAKGSGVGLPSPKKDKPMLKAKSKSRMGR